MKFKKSIVMILVVLLILCIPTCYGALSDIENSRYKTAIEYLSEMSIIAGYEDNTYKPEKVVTRAEMAKFLVVTMGENVEVVSNASEFIDVPSWHWAIKYINIAQQKQLIKGDGDGNFRPDDTVNYGEALTMVVRMLGYDVDIEGEGVWPNNYIDRAKELKLTDNVENFINEQGANRGSVAQIIYNAINNVYKNEGYPLVELFNKYIDIIEDPNSLKHILKYDKNTIKANTNLFLKFSDSFKNRFNGEEDKQSMEKIESIINDSSIDVKFKFDLIDEYAQYIIKYLFKNQEMIEAELNIDTNKVYLFIKDIFKNYLKQEQEESLFDKVFETKELDQSQMMLLDSAEKVLFKKIISSIKNTINTNIKINGVSKNVKKYTIIIDDRDILDIKKNMYKALLKDDELLNSVINYSWLSLEEKREILQEIINKDQLREDEKNIYYIYIYIQEDRLVGIDFNCTTEYFNVFYSTEECKDEIKFNLRIDEDNYLSINLHVKSWLEVDINYSLVIEKENGNKYQYDLDIDNKEYFKIGANGTVELSNEKIIKPDFSASVQELSDEEIKELKDKLMYIVKKMGIEELVEEYIAIRFKTTSEIKLTLFNMDADNIQDAIILYRLNYMVENEGETVNLASNNYVFTIDGEDYYEFKSEITAEELNLSNINLSNWVVSENGRVMHKTGIKDKVDGRYTYYNVKINSDSPITGNEIEVLEYK